MEKNKMTYEEAIELLDNIKKYMCAGNPIWDTEKITIAMDMAINVLKDKLHKGNGRLT